MKICIYCGREAIRVSSFTTGCCRDARKVWALEQLAEAESQMSVQVEPLENELSRLRQTLADVKAPNDSPDGAISINRQILLLADQRNQAQKEVNDAINAIDFATNGFPGNLPERISCVCDTLRKVIQQRDEANRRIEKESDAKLVLLDVMRKLSNIRDGWDIIRGFYESKYRGDEDLLNILLESESRPPGWHR